VIDKNVKPNYLDARGLRCLPLTLCLHRKSDRK
jgi:hypothetical protein